MRKQAKYLIDDIRFNIFNCATSWDYDDRINNDSDSAFPTKLKDDASGFGVRVIREFQKQTTGNMALEMLYITEKSADGVYVKICSEKDEVLFSFTTKDGYFYFNDKKTDIPSVLGVVRTKVSFDLDKKSAVFFVDGKTACSDALGEFCDASKLILGTTGETEIIVEPVKNKLYIDYIANENFLGTQTYIPQPWIVDGDFVMNDVVYEDWKNRYTYPSVTAKAGEKKSAYLPVDKTEGNVICEGYFFMPEGADEVRFALKDADKEIFAVKTNKCCFETMNGDFLRKFNPNVWQLIRFETDGDNVLVKICGKKCGTFAMNGNSFDGIMISFDAKMDGSLGFADIVCEANIDYPDYCPEPKAVRHPEYEVGMNICNMWREGHHFGWDRITYFKDNLPLIGPYDEGLPEVADWEIKMMVEHGVTFQHFCWYCPNTVINAPFKRSRMDNALRDGFMNSRYSDMMKFIIMWENTIYADTNPENFKNYIWPYWCEYYFTDPRYLIINNRPVVNLWCMKFVDQWGGPEKAKEVISFMNEDIKKFGFDGMYIMATASGFYKDISDYADITYTYHFGKQGYSPDHQKACINNLNGYHEKDGLAAYMQTASVGFNACPWHGADARVPLITPDDFEDVLRFIKKHNDDIENKDWQDKLFMMSTWNEYGEGTYIMPSHLHGFEYLDRIRKVFVDENGQNENLLPDESQQKRITYLRVPDRVMIRRLGYEKITGVTPNTVVNGIYFDKDFDKSIIRACGNNLEFTGNSVIVSPSNEDREHYDVLLVDKENGIFNADEGTHIRVKIRSVGGYSTFRVPFLTKDDQRWNHKKITPNFFSKDSDGVIIYDFYIKSLQTWKGIVTDIRVDNMNKVPFEIISIELMKYVGELIDDVNITANGNVVRFEFNPIVKDGDVVVSFDPGLGAFRRLKLYWKYFETTKTLELASTKHTVLLTLDSSEAIVDGKTKALRVPMTMRDGLPTFSVNELCDFMGYKYEFDGKDFKITL